MTHIWYYTELKNTLLVGYVNLTMNIIELIENE